MRRATALATMVALRADSQTQRGRVLVLLLLVLVATATRRGWDTPVLRRTILLRRGGDVPAMGGRVRSKRWTPFRRSWSRIVVAR